MKKILVAIDFSPASGKAYEYALGLSRQTGAAVSVLYANTATRAQETVSEQHRLAIIRRENEDYRERLKQFTANYPRQGPDGSLPHLIPEDYLVAGGRASTAIATAATDAGVNLVVLGIRPKHSLVEHLFGSVSTHLVGKTPCPLLLVPEDAAYTRPRRIALAVDPAFSDEAIPPPLDALAEVLGARLTPFHVNLLADEADKYRFEQVEKGEASVAVVRERTVQSGISYYLAKNPADMLALYLPHWVFPENLLHGRLVRHLAWYSPIPLLLVQES